MAKVIKNNKAYDSADVSTFIDGVPIDVEEVNYETEQEHQVNHTLKKDASSWSMGKKSHSCSITVPMHEVVKLEKVYGDLLDIKPFFLNVTFVNEFNSIVNDTLLVKFQKKGREVTGDMNLKMSYDMLTLDIDYNN